MIYNSLTVRLVSHCFTTRTSRTGRRPHYTLQVSLMIYNSPTERLVYHCFARRTSCTGRTGRAWTSLYTLSLSNDIQFASCTTRKPLFHEPYESHRSWTSPYTLSLSNDILFTDCSTRKTLFNDL